MRILKFVAVLAFIGLFNQSNAQSQTDKAIILINSDAFEVSLTKEGEIAKIYKEIPNYLPIKKPFYQLKNRASRTFALNAQPNANNTEAREAIAEVEKVEIATAQPSTEAPVVTTEKTNLSALHEIEFDYNSATLDDKAFRELDKIVVKVSKGTTALVRINSYDNLKEKNSDLLARNRANAAKQYLLIRGVGLDRIQIRITSLVDSDPKITLEMI